MKKLIYLFSITVALSVFSVNANAQTTSSATTTHVAAPGVMADFLSDLLGAIFGNGGSSSGGNTGSGSTGTTNGSTQLPINNGVVFLFIAGAAIGVVTVYKYKVAKTVSQK